MRTTVLSNVANEQELHGTYATIWHRGQLGRGRISVQAGGAREYSIFFCTNNAHFRGATANNLLGKQYSRILAFEQLIEVVNTIHLRDNTQVADMLPDTDLLPTGETVRSHFGLDETPVSADEPEAEAAPEPEVTRNTIMMSVRLYEKLREEVSISGQQAAMFVYRSIDEDRDRANITLEGNFEFPIGNFFDLRDGNISYCPANRRQQFTDSGAWSRDGRQVIKTGKFRS